MFYDLRRCKPGTRSASTRRRRHRAFTVRRVEQYPKYRFPTDEVYGDVDTAQLRLITCGGDFDGQARSYRDNIVVYAELLDKSILNLADPRRSPWRGLVLGGRP